MGCGPSKNSTQSTLEPPPDEGFGNSSNNNNSNNNNNGSHPYYQPPPAAASSEASSGGPSSHNGSATGQSQALPPVPQAPATILQPPPQPSSIVQQQPSTVVVPTTTGVSATPPASNNTTTTTTATTTSAVSGVNGTSNALHISNAEAQWKDLWEALSPHLLDPADVIAVISEVMNDTTNRLLSTDVNFILRRVRHVVRNLPRTNGNFAPSSKIKMGVWTSSGTNNNNSLEAEGKLTAERHHLLSFHVFRRVLGGPMDIPRPDGKEAAMVFPDPVETAYTLLLHFSEPLCERAAAIAQNTAKNAGLEMDVNKGRNFSQRPPPIGPSKEEMPDLPPGITVQAYAFLLALALRK
jgi:hypothetical protein